MRSAGAPVYVQAAFDELDEPLREVTFVVVDLETTGGAAEDSTITEIGAVKVLGGEVLGEFSTLVDPGRGIQPFVAVLTGITDTMVAAAPLIDAVLPAFLEFAGDAVLVAHNAPFDIGFLKAACARAGRDWPAPRVVDTALLARRVLTSDEVPDCKLATLAAHFHATTAPTHRALADARATVDVLHALIERLGPLGVQSIEELRSFTAQVSEAQRRKRHLAEHLPNAPGVYVFRDAGGRPLYVGTSKDIRSRVRHYFVASEQRSRMAEMVALADRVDAIVCAHALEAEVRELRMIAEHKPPYNRRSRFPERGTWLKLTAEPYPRLSAVRSVRDDGGTYLGPFGSRRSVDQAMAAVHDALPLRQCTDRLPAGGSQSGSACVLAEMDRCGAPCEGRISPQDYQVHAEVVRTAVTGDPRQLTRPLLRKVERLAAAGRFEHAAVVRDRLSTFVRACARVQRISGLTSIDHLVAARPDGRGGWEIAVVRRGRLVAAGVAPRGAAVRPYVAGLVATAESALPGIGPLPCATAGETERVLRWLEEPGTRLVELEGVWSCPAYGAGGLGELLERRETGTDPLADRRRIRPVARPART
ncbi:MAG TPA: DEDD exonuclease domain-containing protein [Mycobacteriales bacterium]|nr:DEDD exonuclease domain-containing protein [Mycobacteriales bacterium]